MRPHDDTGKILDLDKICALVAEAGYDGLAIDLGAGDVKLANDVYPYIKKSGLTPLIVAFPKIRWLIH